MKELAQIKPTIQESSGVFYLTSEELGIVATGISYEIAEKKFQAAKEDLLLAIGNSEIEFKEYFYTKRAYYVREKMKTRSLFKFSLVLLALMLTSISTLFLAEHLIRKNLERVDPQAKLERAIQKILPKSAEKREERLARFRATLDKYAPYLEELKPYVKEIDARLNRGKMDQPSRR